MRIARYLCAGIAKPAEWRLMALEARAYISFKDVAAYPASEIDFKVGFRQFTIDDCLQTLGKLAWATRDEPSSADVELFATLPRNWQVRALKTCPEFADELPADLLRDLERLRDHEGS